MGDSIVGQYGLMPEDMLYRKHEKTCLFEDPDQIENHMRQELSDFRPVAPTLESDQIRGGMEYEVDENGKSTPARTRGYQSYGVLELRHGGRRSEAEPWLPDGTFLDHQFVGPGKDVEPRSIMYQPDMRKHVDQQYARAKYIKFYPDHDHSIPEKGWHPADVVRQLAQSRHWVKDRMKIFETARVGWHNGSSVQIPLIKKSSVLDTVGDTEFAQEGPTLRTRIGHTTAGSNDIPIGWRSTSDQRFKVAKYGIMKSHNVDADKDWYQNRRGAYFDHDIFISIEDKPVQFATAIAIIDTTAERRRTLAKERNTIDFAKSMERMNQKKQMIQEMMVGENSRKSDITQSKSAHAELGGEQGNLQQRAPTLDQKMGKTIINQKIFKTLVGVNKKMTKRERKDLRENIIDSSSKHELFLEQAPGTSNTKFGDVINDKRKSNTVHIKGEEKKTFNFSHAARPSNKSNMPRHAFESYGNSSKQRNQRRGGRLDRENMNVKSTRLDGEFGRDTTANRHAGKIGSKYMRNHMTTDERNPDDMNDRV